MPHSGASLCRITGTRRLKIPVISEALPQLQHRLEEPLQERALLEQDVGVDEHAGAQRQLLVASAVTLWRSSFTSTR